VTASNTSKESGTFWALLPVGLLSACVLGLGTMGVIASRDASFSLERDYYEQAVHWDRQQAQWGENARLGYRLELVSAEPTELVVRVRTADGQELRGASVRAEAFANDRAASIHQLEFRQAPDGTYRTQLAEARPGLWEFRFRVERASRRFTEVVRTDLRTPRLER
jgi:hypothetical protein